MSPPPRPHSERSTGADQSGDPRRLDYLPLEYADLLDLEQDLTATRLGRSRAVEDDADVTRTFLELSALVGHVLSVYQRHRAGEAYLSTAQAPSSLVRHAHRLAFDPDPGLAANGYVVLRAKKGVRGTVAAGLALASAPLGDTPAQDYETRDDLLVDSALDEMVPVGARRPVVIASDARSVRLDGVGHGLRAGDRIALDGRHRRGFVVVDVTEHPASATTAVALDRPVGAKVDVGADVVAGTPPVLLARPTRTLRPFGSGADPALYPPEAIQDATGTAPQNRPRFHYTVARAGGGGEDAADVYLSEPTTTPVAGSVALRCTGVGADSAGMAVFTITSEIGAAVTLHREVEEAFTTQTVTLRPDGAGGFTTTTVPATGTLTVTSHVSGTVTAIRVVADAGGDPVPRATHPFPAEWLTGWTVTAPLAAHEPDPSPVRDQGPDPVDRPLELPGLLDALSPGRPMAFRNRAGTAAQIVAVRRAELDPDRGVTRVWWDPVTAPPETAWTLDDVVVLGNVVRVSHGRTVHETLGGSDGVSAFQRFTLRESPVTVLPGPAGGEPEIGVRVGDVRWTRVPDFTDSGPDDRHYRTVTDQEQVTTVVFGDGRTGAVPPSGRSNVTADYRVGLGRDGDVEPLRLSRLRRAHPLLDGASNVTPITGGVAPAGPEALRTQSTRWIRTFDRAVSVRDLADLALTMPGVARAAARWDQALGVVLVVATAQGTAPPAPDSVRAFLDARRDVSVPLVLRRPRARAVVVAVDVEPDPAFLVEAVRDAVRAALHGEGGLFTFAARELGGPAYLSEVYQRLEAVTGVVGVTVTRFTSRDTDGRVDVIPADVDEWLSLQPNDLTVTVAGGAP